MSVDDLEAVACPTQLTHRRLLVTQKDISGFYRPVGFLGAAADGGTVSYTFDYLRSAVQQPGFRPFLGFSDVGRSYRSEGLFPLFAERIMDPRRPEHPVFLAALDLTEDASPLEVLARSGGQRAGDGIMLLPEPAVGADGRTHCVFLVHGMRWVDDAESVLPRLRVGDRLVLEAEPHNAANPRALVVLESSGQRLGYVPDALLEHVHAVREPRLTVVRVNGPEVGIRLRLLVRLDGQVEANQAAFSGPGWETVVG